MLHLTNGDLAAGLLERAGVGGMIVPWRDVLHEGPVPAGLSLDALSEVRARYLAGQGWGDLASIRAGFAARNGLLSGFRDHDEVVLWFEADLYDQLQVAQILDWLAGRARGHTRLALIDAGALDRVRGIGGLAANQVAPLFETRRQVTDAQLDMARAAWEAYRSPDPTGLEKLAASASHALPLMGAALRRHLQQFPSTHNGLGRTEHHALASVDAGIVEAVALLRAHWEQEERPFMGDWAFWAYLKKLAGGARPLLLIEGPRDDARFARARLAITEDGRRVLRGSLDFVHLNGIDCWLGGVHLVGRTPAWRWDEAAACLSSSA